MEKIPIWFIFAMVALVAWGLWGFFPKLTTTYISPKSALVWEAVGAALVGLVVLAFIGFKPDLHPRGVALGIATGICGLTGALAFLYAVSKGKASVVVTMTALYPLVVIALSVLFLHETITLRQGIGIIFGLTAVVLLVT